MKESIKNAERGQSLTELAITMSFLLILLAGVADIGRVFFTYIALRDAAQEGAIYGTYEAKDCAGIINRVRQTSSYPISLSAVAVDVTIGSYSCSSPPADPQPCSGDEIEVVVTDNNFPITTPFIGAMLSSQTMVISASVKDSVITPVCTTP
jgi:hypothetical protein